MSDEIRSRGAYRSAMRVAFAEIDQDVPRGVQTVHHVGGSYSSCSLDSCCTSPHEAVWCRRNSRSTDLTCSLRWIGLLFSHPAWTMLLAVETLTMWNQGLHARRHSSHTGEFSAARQALEGAAVAPWTRETLNPSEPSETPSSLPRPNPSDTLHVAPAETDLFGL